MAGFGRVEKKLTFGGRAFGNRAEPAAAGAEISQNHEGRGAALKTLVDVRTAGGFAYSVQAALAKLLFQRMERLEMGFALA